MIWTWSRRFASWSVMGGLSTSSLLAFGAEEPRIRLIQDADQRPVAIEAIGLTHHELAPLTAKDANTADFATRLAVIVVNDRGVQLPLVSGTYHVEEGTLRFTPRYPLQPGLTYRVVLQLNDSVDPLRSSADWLETDIVIPSATAPQLAAAVQLADPSSEALPERTE